MIVYNGFFNSHNQAMLTLKSSAVVDLS